LEEKYQWGDREIDGKMSYRGMQPTCSGFGTGKAVARDKELRKKVGEASWPRNRPKRHRRRIY
jgi:hypothetical protein